jgi:hypothetical protein
MVSRPIEYEWVASSKDREESEMADRTLSQPDRQAVFLALVEAQDGGMTPAQSRESIAEQFAVSEDLVRRIEREGIDGGWPPLG